MSVRTIIALAGRAGAGKDTAAHLMHDAIWNSFPDDGVVISGFAKRLKRALKEIFNIDFEQLTREEKEERLDWIGRSPRELMQSLGTEWGRSIHPDMWILLLERSLFDQPSKFGEVFILTDCRFPNEVAWVKRKGGAVWWVERTGMPAVATHSSESAIGPQHCDRTILNLGSEHDLQVAVGRAWTQHVRETVRFLPQGCRIDY